MIRPTVTEAAERSGSPSSERHDYVWRHTATVGPRAREWFMHSAAVEAPHDMKPFPKLTCVATLFGALACMDRQPTTVEQTLHEFDAAWTAGRALSLHEVVAEAVAETTRMANDGFGQPPAARLGRSRREVGIAPGQGDRDLAIARDQVADKHAGLTPREREVLRLVAQGHTNQQIADILFIGIPPVKSHLTSVLGKLGLPSRSAATAYAHTHGLL